MVRGGEVELHPQGLRDGGVRGELLAPVGGDRVQRLVPQRPYHHLADLGRCLLEAFAAHQVAAFAVHQGDEARPARGARDGVGLPVAQPGPGIGLLGTLRYLMGRLDLAAALGCF